MQTQRMSSIAKHLTSTLTPDGHYIIIANCVTMRTVISLESSSNPEESNVAKKAEDIKIDPVLCKGCHICIFVCPQEVLKQSETVDNRGFYLPEVVDLDTCKICKLCEMECPDFAISVLVKED